MITPECSLLIFNSLCSGVDFICVSSPEVIVLQLASPCGGVLTIVFLRIMCSNRRVNSMLDARKQVVFCPMDASKKKVFLKCVWQMSVISKPAWREKIISVLSSHRCNPLAWTSPPNQTPHSPMYNARKPQSFTGEEKTKKTCESICCSVSLSLGPPRSDQISKVTANAG